VIEPLRGISRPLTKRREADAALPFPDGSLDGPPGGIFGLLRNVYAEGKALVLKRANVPNDPAADPGNSAHWTRLPIHKRPTLDDGVDVGANRFLNDGVARVGRAVGYRLNRLVCGL